MVSTLLCFFLSMVKYSRAASLIFLLMKFLKEFFDMISVINKVQEKVEEFNCGECETTFKSTNELDNHVQRDHTKGADDLFQKLKNKITPNEPKEEFQCSKCGFNAETVSNFMKHICSKEMKTIIR